LPPPPRLNGLRIAAPLGLPLGYNAAEREKTLAVVNRKREQTCLVCDPHTDWTGYPNWYGICLTGFTFYGMS